MSISVLLEAKIYYDDDRKNFLFSKNENGAKSSCILFTIIDLAYENKLEPRVYLEYVLDDVRGQDF